MTTKQLFLTFLLTLLLSNSVFADKITHENRDVSSFSEVSLRISGNLYIEQGAQQSIKIEASKATLQEIITEVKDRCLNIRFKSNNFFRRSFNPGSINIYITTPEINALTISGSGDIIAKKLINSRILDLKVSGSGDISLKELSSERVNIVVSGSGDVLINKGKEIADELKVTISGSGDVNTEKFEAKTVNAKISGSGDCIVNTNGNLKGRVVGSGSILYKGDPLIDTSIVGSGKIEKR